MFFFDAPAHAPALCFHGHTLIIRVLTII